MNVLELRSRAVPVELEPTARPETRSATPRRDGWVMAGFLLALLFLMFAPLMRPGTVWFLDSPASLMGAHPRVPDAAWSSAPWVVIRAPFEWLLAAINRGLPWGQVRLLPLFAVPVTATLGFRKLFAGRVTTTIAASLLFVINPFTYERMAAGQEYFLLGVAALPVILAIVVRARSGVRAGIVAGLVLVGASALSPHLAFVGGTLALALLAGALLARQRVPAVAAGMALGVVALALLPLALVSAPSSPGGADLAAFRTASDPAFGLVANVVGLYGFWRQGWPLAKEALPAWPVFVAAMLVVAGIGVAKLRGGRDRALRFAIVLAGAAGLALAMGDRGPTGAAFAWLYRAVPPFRVMREPQKFLALFALALAVGFGLGVAELARRARSRRARAALLVVLLAVPCAASFRSFWGLGGSVAPSSTPSSWVAADRIMGPGAEAVLILPWHRYLRFPFTQDRVVASPFLSAFDRPVIVSDDPELAGVAGVLPDPRAARIGALLSAAGTSDRFGASLATADVGFVVLAKVQDWRAYAWVFDQIDLEPVATWGDLVLFENLAA